MSDWVEKRVGELIDGLEAGVSVRARDGDTSRPVVLKTSAVAQGRVDFQEVKSIIPADISRARCKPARGSIVISRMNTPALVGAVGYVASDEIDVFLPDRLWMANSSRHETTDMRWLAYMLGFGVVANGIRELATGTSNSMKNIPKSRLLRFALSVPPLSEQAMIAEALASADSLIVLLERALTKKRAIKRGMMQELLTGENRLPGFAGEWAERSAGDIGVFKGGSGFPIRYQGGRGAEYPYFKVSDMNSHGNETFMISANNSVSEVARARIGATVFPPGAIVFAKVGAAVFLERKRLLVAPSCIDNNMAAFVVDARIAYPRFVHYALMNYRLSSLVAVKRPEFVGGS